MVPVWRLTRTPHARRAYELLKRVGVTATRMYEFRAPAAADPSPAEVDVDVQERRKRGLRPGAIHAYDDLRPGETVLVARTDGTVVGSLFLSTASRQPVEPLETSVEFPGAYLRRVWVDPDYRNRGVATELVTRARARAATGGADTVHALVAQDNRPSRWLFEGCGFERRRLFTYYRLFGLRHRNVRPVPG
jgi:ribosomal protein S18 acetylase RimI-like enzyme